MDEPEEKRASSRWGGWYLQTHGVFQTSSGPAQASLSTGRLQGAGVRVSPLAAQQPQGEAVSLWSGSVPETPLARKLPEGMCLPHSQTPAATRCGPRGGAVELRHEGVNERREQWMDPPGRQAVSSLPCQIPELQPF